MKKSKAAVLFASLILSVFTAGSLMGSGFGAVKAESAWTSIETKATASESAYNYDKSDAYYYITLSVSDYADASSEAVHLESTAYYDAEDYNFTSYVQLSDDNENYVSFSTIHLAFDFFFANGRFRLGVRRTDDIAAESTYRYVRVLAGCEFPSYNYCVNGGTRTKYVQKDTVISERGTTVNYSDIVADTTYAEYTPKDTLALTGIAPGWNNVFYSGDPEYRQLILSFGTWGVDYLAKSRTADATNRATTDYDIGNKLTINGVSIARIHDCYPSTRVSYEHGYDYFFVNYPVDILKLTPENKVTTLHIAAGTEFMDVLLPEVTLRLIGECWTISDADVFSLENPLDIELYSLVDLPHHVGSDAHAMFGSLPKDDFELAFNINTGDVDLANGTSLINIAMYGGITTQINFATGVVTLLDPNYSIVQTFSGLMFLKNTDYTLEFYAETTSATTFRMAIDHLLVLDYVFASGITYTDAVWVVDMSNAITVSLYKEKEYYQPKLYFGGSSSYDFAEGDPVYDFADVVSAFSVYDENVSAADVIYEYESGAVTDGRYNAGTWTLTITLSADGYATATKTVLINVHGKTSMATITYDDGDPIQVPVGSKLVPPANPATYRDGEYDYVFDGWYHDGAKWDFANDIVQGDMKLVSRFKATTHHYVITVHFEGVERGDETYSVASGSTLPLDIFELEGATCVVYEDDAPITSLTVTGDVTLTVVYTVLYTYIEPKEPTCTEDGNIGYWYSPVYAGYGFADAEGREILRNYILPATGHDIIHLDARDSTCHELGNIDCFYCTRCHGHFADAEGKEELTDWSIEKKAHVLTHHEAVMATCTEDGNVEYWTCANEPGVFYGDEACTYTLEATRIPATGHDYRAPSYEWTVTADGYECTATIRCTYCQDAIRETKPATCVVIREATCTEEGQVSYSVSFSDPRFSAQTKLVRLEKTPHQYVFVEEVSATKEQDGVKAHYECSVCHGLFTRSGDAYSEVTYEELILRYSPSGCQGSIQSASFLTLFGAGTFTLLCALRRKEHE